MNTRTLFLWLAAATLAAAQTPVATVKVNANTGALISPSAATFKSANGFPSFDGAFSSLTGKPTTLSGYGITDAQGLDSDLTSIAALTTTSFGRSLLTQADAAAARTTLGAGTSSFGGAFSSLTGVPTTLAGYGITDAQAGSAVLAALAANSGTVNLGSLTLTLPSGFVTTSGSQTLTNKTISGGSNTLSAIGNAALTNSAITIGGTSTSLGGTITTTTMLDSLGSTRGSVLERGASGWAAVTPGTSGYVWTSQGSGADPHWAAAGGGGSSIATGAVGWCSEAGDDGTGALGDPAHPYATAAAAVTAGAVALVLLPRTDNATYGDVTNPPIRFALIGFGAGVSRLGSITGFVTPLEIDGNGMGLVSVSIIAPSDVTNGALVVSGLRLAGVSTAGYIQADGAAANFDFESGGHGGLVSVFGCDLIGASIYASGGNGHDGSDDGMTPTTGTAGGNGGIISVFWSRTEGSVSGVASHGLGGTGFNGGSNGSDGSDGSARTSTDTFNTQ